MPEHLGITPEAAARRDAAMQAMNTGGGPGQPTGGAPGGAPAPTGASANIGGGGTGRTFNLDGGGGGAPQPAPSTFLAQPPGGVPGRGGFLPQPAGGRPLPEGIQFGTRLPIGGGAPAGGGISAAAPFAPNTLGGLLGKMRAYGY
jgi:hypothetical protein